MRQLEYQVSFNTPAFLGNAEQQAQWRTPPFKALIRQWWRVAKAPTVNYDYKKLLTEENALFGAASDSSGGGSHRSLIRLRLSSWEHGKLTGWPANEPKVNHPEVKFPVGAELYLGYGPLDYDKASKSAKFVESKTSGARRNAIENKASANLRIMLPDGHREEVLNSMQLAAWFGTLGSRARNGWGALQIVGEGIEGIGTVDRAKLAPYTRMLSECLQSNYDWPHAIGADEKGPLVWLTAEKPTWREVMKDLAAIKIAFRTHPEFSLAGVRNGSFSKRHVLAYPVTKHSINVKEWGAQGRLANQVRFKVARSGQQLLGVIVHLPCALPFHMATELGGEATYAVQLKVWSTVRDVLDNPKTGLRRLK